MARSRRRRAALIIALSLLSLLVLFISLAAHALDDTDQRHAMAATVQVTAMVNPPDFKAPWQCRPTESLTGSGVLVEGGRVLTNAHVVANAVSLELRRQGLPDRYPARVEHIDHASDLALLRVDDPAFSAGAELVPLGGMPEVGQAVNVYGYPLDTNTVCSTEGVVSLVECAPYTHSLDVLLVAQIDASINPGSSGGPAIAGGRIVGLAMQKPDQTEGAGQFIPAPVIRRFLDDVADGRVDGVPSLGVGLQDLESGALRRALGMTPDQTGLMVCDVAADGSAGDALRRHDVLLAIDGHAVANDGTVGLEGDLRVDGGWLVKRRQVGEQVMLDVLRDGARLRPTITLRPGGLMLDGPWYPDRAPYRVLGGLVFQPADMDLALSQRESLPNNIMRLWVTDAVRTEACRQRVALGRVLPHEVNRGFHLWGGEFIETVQGVPVRDFAHLNQLLDGATGRWLDIATDDGMRIVLDLPAARAASPAILRTFNIAADRWPGAPSVDAAAAPSVVTARAVRP